MEESANTHSIADYSDEELAEFLSLARATRTAAQTAINRAEFEFLKRLKAEGAKEKRIGDRLVRIKPPGRKYVWDGKYLMQHLPEVLTEKEIDALVDEDYVITYKVQTNKLLALAEKRGDRLREIVGAAHEIEETGYEKIELEEPR